MATSVTSSSNSATGVQRAVSREHLGERRDEHAHLAAHVDERQQRVARALEGDDVRHLDALEDDPRIEATLHEDRVRRRVGAEAVEARLAVEVALRRVVLAGELVVEEARAVIQPVRLGVLGVGNALGQVAPVGDVQHVQDRVLAAVPGEPVHHARAVRGCLPPVEREMAAGAGLERRVDEHVLHAAFLDEQLEVVGADRALLEEAAACRRAARGA